MRQWHYKHQKERDDVLKIVENIDKLVDHKIKNISVAASALVAAILPVLSYVLITETKSVSLFIVVAIWAIGVILPIIWEHLPIITRKDKPTRKKYLKMPFSIDNLTLGAYYSNADYLNAYQKTFNRKLNEQEITAIMLLKNKLNEMRFRVNCLIVSFAVVLVGIVVFIVILIGGLAML